MSEIDSKTTILVFIDAVDEKDLQYKSTDKLKLTCRVLFDVSLDSREISVHLLSLVSLMNYAA